jgi:hypothetical protein
MATLETLPNVSQVKINQSIFPDFPKGILPDHHEIMKFDWENKWLKGEEYAHILNNLDIYCKDYNLVKFPAKTHPSSIYTEPQSRVTQEFSLIQ